MNACCPIFPTRDIPSTPACADPRPGVSRRGYQKNCFAIQMQYKKSVRKTNVKFGGLRLQNQVYSIFEENQFVTRMTKASLE